MVIRRYRTRREIRPSEVTEAPHASGSRTEKPDKIFARAVKLLAARARSETEIRDRLSPIADENVIDRCISKLKESGLIDDAKFAASYASHRIRTKPVGRARIARELAARGVTRSIINEALSSVFQEVDEETLIDLAIEKRLRTVTKPLDRNGTKRLFDHLARLGFDRELIISRVRALRAGTGKTDRLS